MQLTDRKLCLTERQKPIRTVRTERTVRSINGPLQCGYIGQPMQKPSIEISPAPEIATAIVDHCTVVYFHLVSWSLHGSEKSKNPMSFLALFRENS